MTTPPPRDPWAEPGPQAPPAQAAWPQGTVLPQVAPSSRHRWFLPVALLSSVVVAVVVVAALVAGVTDRQSGRTSAADPAGDAQAAAVEPPELSADLTPAAAPDWFRQLWQSHERAMLARDLRQIRALEDGAARDHDIGLVQCSICIGWSAPRPVLDVRVFIPSPHGGAETVAAELAVAGDRRTDEAVVVVRRASRTQPWRVVIWSEFGSTAPGTHTALGSPASDASGYDTAVPAWQRAEAERAPRLLAALWQAAKDQGTTSSAAFLSGRVTDQRAAMLARHRQDAVQANGYRQHFTFYQDPSDGVFTFAEADGWALSCAPIRETIETRGTADHPVWQDRKRTRWGHALPPGTYRSLTNTAIWETCFLISPVPGAPLAVISDVGSAGELTHGEPAS